MSNYGELKKSILSLIFTDFINNVNKDVKENKISISDIADNIANELSINILDLKFLTDNNFCSLSDIIKEYLQLTNIIMNTPGEKYSLSDLKKTLTNPINEYFCDGEALPDANSINTVFRRNLNVINRENSEKFNRAYSFITSAYDTKEFCIKDGWKNTHELIANLIYRLNKFSSVPSKTFNFTTLKNKMELFWGITLEKDINIELALTNNFYLESLFHYSSISHIIKNYNNAKERISKQFDSPSLSFQIFWGKLKVERSMTDYDVLRYTNSMLDRVVDCASYVSSNLPIVFSHRYIINRIFKYFTENLEDALSRGVEWTENILSKLKTLKHIILPVSADMFALYTEANPDIEICYDYESIKPLYEYKDITPKKKTNERQPAYPTKVICPIMLLENDEYELSDYHNISNNLITSIYENLSIINFHRRERDFDSFFEKKLRKHYFEWINEFTIS